MTLFLWLWMNLFHSRLGSLLRAALYRFWPLSFRRFRNWIILVFPWVSLAVFQIIKVLVGLLFQRFWVIEGQNLLLLLFSLIVLKSLVDVGFVSFLDFNWHSRPIWIFLLLQLFRFAFLRSRCAGNTVLFQHDFIVLIDTFHEVLDGHGYFLLVNWLLNGFLRSIWRWLNLFGLPRRRGTNIFRRLIIDYLLFLLIYNLWFVHNLTVLWGRAEELLSAHVLSISWNGFRNTISLNFSMRHILCFGDGFFSLVQLHDDRIVLLLLLLDNFRHRNRCQRSLHHNSFLHLFNGEELAKLRLFLIC